VYHIWITFSVIALSIIIKYKHKGVCPFRLVPWPTVPWFYSYLCITTHKWTWDFWIARIAILHYTGVTIWWSTPFSLTSDIMDIKTSFSDEALRVQANILAFAFDTLWFIHWWRSYAHLRIISPMNNFSFAAGICCWGLGW
jgi:hypothetical protein